MSIIPLHNICQILTFSNNCHKSLLTFSTGAVVFVGHPCDIRLLAHDITNIQDVQSQHAFLLFLRRGRLAAIRHLLLALLQLFLYTTQALQASLLFLVNLGHRRLLVKCR